VLFNKLIKAMERSEKGHRTGLFILLISSIRQGTYRGIWALTLAISVSSKGYPIHEKP
jgi:hypothetical protein